GKGRKIAARRIDGAVLDRICAELQSKTVAARIGAMMQSLIDAPVDGRKIAGLEKRLASASSKIAKLIDLQAEAEPAVRDAYKRSIFQTESERAALVDELTILRERADLAEAVQQITPEEVQQLLRTLFENLKAGVETGEAE